jgi:hypothetical protein
MDSEDDMDAPVTRRELKGFEQGMEKFQTRLNELMTQTLVKHTEWFAQWMSRQEDWLQNNFAQEHEWFARWRVAQDETLEKRLSAQAEVLTRYADELLTRHANAIMEHQRTLIGGLDDYSSLPPRTTALEETVAELAPRVATVERKVFAPRKRQPTKRTTRRR